MRSLARLLAGPLFGLLAVASPGLVLAQDAAKSPTTQKTPESKPLDAKTADAKPAEAKIDPEAQRVFDTAREALKKIRDITFKVKQEGAGQSGESASGVLTITLPEKPAMGLPFDKYKATLLDDKGQPKSDWSIDGKKVYKIDHAAKKFYTLEVKDTHTLMPPEELWGILPQWLFEDRTEMPGMKTISLTLGKDAEIAGVKCRVLTRIQEIEMPAMEEEDEPAADAKSDKGDKTDKPAKAEKKPGKIIVTLTKHIAIDDMLPRKVELSYTSQGMGDMGRDMHMVSEMAALKANAGVKDDEFVLKAPDGFTSETGTFDNMGLQDPDAEAPKLKAEAGKPALPFKLKDAKDNEVTLDSLKGRVVLLDFWATWCGPCKAAMPSIQKLHEKFADKPVTVIGVNCWEQKPETAIKYVEKQKYTYTLLLKGDDLAKAYGISGIPTLILIGKDGNVLEASVGFGEGEMDHLIELIQKELDRK